LSLIVLPMVAAWLTERWVERRPERAAVTGRLARLPVPLLALVVFFIAAGQVQAVTDALPVLGRVLLVFLLYLVGAALIAATLARWLGMTPGPSRTLIFSLGSRNSFVVLPLALALPARLAGRRRRHRLAVAGRALRHGGLSLGRAALFGGRSAVGRMTARETVLSSLVGR
jgi:ACR3 family arsenite efflux pump ArsB